MTHAPDPQPAQFWSTAKGRAVEILAVEQILDPDVLVVAYRFFGASQVHLRAAHTLTGWTKLELE